MATLTLPSLIPHGDYVAADYAPLPGTDEGLAGRSTNEERKPGVQTIKQRFRRDEYTGWNPQAMGCIKAIYLDAIEYRTQTSEKMGGLFCWGVLLFGMTTFVLGFYLFLFQDATSLVVGAPLFGFALLGCHMLIKGTRAVYQAPADLPVIFDRKHRKVYRILQEVPPGILGTFKPWPIRAVAYEWDLLDAEHHAQVHVHSAGSHRNDFLVFLVRKSADDPTVIDSFSLGDAGMLTDLLAANMYEHIRRFMELRGPHLPRSDETLAQFHEEEVSWWRAQSALGPFGPQYFKWWREFPLVTLVIHVIFPVSLPMGLLFGTGNWIGHKTAVIVTWPREVLDAIGSPLRTGAGYMAEIDRCF